MSISPRRGSAASLSMMMFLQYAVWGVWLPYLASYLGADDESALVVSISEDLTEFETWLGGLSGFDVDVRAPLAVPTDAAANAADALVGADADARELATEPLVIALSELVESFRELLPDPGPDADANLSAVSLTLANEELRVWMGRLNTHRQDLEFENFGLGFTGAQIGWILGLAGSIGALFAPFIAGQVADRFLNAEKALGLLLIGGGIVKFGTAYATDLETFMGLSILYSILYMPTLALTNSIAFANIDDAEKSFPRIRTWGTIGWIVASNAFPLIWLQMNLSGSPLPPFVVGEPKPEGIALIADCLKVSGVLAVAYGIWAMLALPKTPPKKDVENPFAFVKAFGMLRHPGFLVVTLAALPIAMIHQVYFFRTSPYLETIGVKTANIGPMMSIGQFSEIAFLAILGLFLKKLGYRLVLSLGCLAYFVRFGLFSLATDASSQSVTLAAVAMVLHGLCYGFFFAGAYVYIEKLAPSDIRHSVQTVFGIIILGIGPVLAGVYNQQLDTLTLADGAMDYARIWQVQALIGLVCAVGVAVAFRPGLPGTREGVDAAAHEVPEAGGAPPTS